MSTIKIHCPVDWYQRKCYVILRIHIAIISHLNSSIVYQYKKSINEWKPKFLRKKKSTRIQYNRIDILPFSHYMWTFSLCVCVMFSMASNLFSSIRFLSMDHHHHHLCPVLSIRIFNCQCLQWILILLLLFGLLPFESQFHTIHHYGDSVLEFFFLFHSLFIRIHVN